MNQPPRNSNHPHWRRVTSIVSTLSMLLLLLPLFDSRPTVATTPEQASINDILGNSSELLIRRSGRRESAQIGSVLQGIRDALITVPPNNARALLRFLSGDGDDLNLYVQTNPHPESAIYYFPCQIQGGDYLIGWGLARNASRGCENGMHAVRGRSTSAEASSLLMARSLKQLAQAPARQLFYCSAAGNNGTLSFASTSSGDPCADAVQQCQADGGGACEVTTAGFWWSNEEKLQATLTCLDQQSFAVEGTGETIASQLEPLIQQTQGQSCNLQVYRAQDLVMVPAADSVVTAMGDDEVLVHIQDTPTGLQVDVLKGAINVSSGGNPEPQIVRKGERYLYSESGGEMTTFNRTEALTSVDMEVLCAFASYPENNLNVSACREANLGLNPGQSPIAFCNLEQASGGQEGDRRTLQMGSNHGEIDLDYEMFDVPDRFQIIYEGQEILDTGFISGSGNLSIPFSGHSGRVDVIVTGNQDISTTQWNYTLYCPK